MTEMGVSVSQRVEKVARVVQLFTSDELAQLVSLVPQLQDVEPLAEGEAARYFQRELLSRRGGALPKPEDAFIGGLTYGEYLALSEEDEAVFWDGLFQADELEIDDLQEQDVQSDARVPAR